MMTLRNITDIDYIQFVLATGPKVAGSNPAEDDGF
jgi:hypothetical protein